MCAQFSQGHALIIGVGADLPNTVDDARGIAGILADSERCAYPTDQVVTLTEAQATRTNILRQFDRMANAIGEDDAFIFYFSGHGYQVKSNFGNLYYLMPYGYDTSQLPRTAVSGVEFLTKLNAIKAKKMLILLDCCHAGGMDDAQAKSVVGAEISKAPLPAEAADQLGGGSGRVIIASSTADELSYAGNPYSAFTLALVEALAGEGAADQDGYVRAADLALYARQMVPQRTNEKQHPVLDFQQADNFAVAYYAAGDSAPKGLPFTVEPQIEEEPGQMYGNQTIETVQEGGVTIGGSGNVTISGDVAGRDIHKSTTVSGDQISVGDITGSSGVAIGSGASSTVNSGDNINMSGDFRGAMVNVKSTLNNVQQTIGGMTNANDDEKAELEGLVKQLEEALAKVPASNAEDAEAISQMTESLVELAAQETPNKTMLQITSEGLKQAAQNLADITPNVVKIATSIAGLLIGLG